MRNVHKHSTEIIQSSNSVDLHLNSYLGYNEIVILIVTTTKKN